MARKLGKRDFYVQSTAVDGYAATSNFTTDAFDLTDRSSPWVFYATGDFTTGNPLITLQVSDDGTNWFDYRQETVNVSIPVAIRKKDFLPKYLRVVFTSNQSDNTVTFKISFIND
ncbi:MAG: hypothetical protein HRU18_26950 [Pseudoalteromonas sp.]|uniref:hypothetical protein n=1 Tax=Pseudoalteromonas sp. TaxID=53249 RepID=UPI001D403B6F|nr:hypothetical protein [Pseudoalteromonas sp.]NRA81852.1 hypothetical protein [Pseudoalteromonas sp.]